MPTTGELANPLWPLSPFITDNIYCSETFDETLGRALIGTLGQLKDAGILEGPVPHFTPSSRRSDFYRELQLTFDQPEVASGIREFVDNVLSLTPWRLPQLSTDGTITYLIGWVTRWSDIENDLARDQVFDLIAVLANDELVADSLAATVIIALFTREHLSDLIKQRR